MTPFLIRPATDADKAPVLAYCAPNGNGNDYIAEVYDDWLTEPNAALFVGTLDDQPIALAHVVIDGDEAWFEGLRVARSHQGRGYGRHMLRHCADTAQQRGARVMRLLTGRANETMQHLLPRMGFEHLFDAMWYQAATLDGPPPQPVTRPVDELLHEIADAPLLHETGGLYAHGWSFATPTQQLLAEHLRLGEIVQLPGVAGWAIVMPDGEGERQVIALAVGDVPGLLHGLRTHPAAKTSGYLRILVPEGSRFEQIVKAAGYSSAYAHRFSIYALAL